MPVQPDNSAQKVIVSVHLPRHCVTAPVLISSLMASIVVLAAISAKEGRHAHRQIVNVQWVHSTVTENVSIRRQTLHTVALVGTSVQLDNFAIKAAVRPSVPKNKRAVVMVVLMCRPVHNIVVRVTMPAHRDKSVYKGSVNVQLDVSCVVELVSICSRTISTVEAVTRPVQTANCVPLEDVCKNVQIRPLRAALVHVSIHKATLATVANVAMNVPVGHFVLGEHVSVLTARSNAMVSVSILITHAHIVESVTEPAPMVLFAREEIA